MDRVQLSHKIASSIIESSIAIRQVQAIIEQVFAALKDETIANEGELVLEQEGLVIMSQEVYSQLELASAAGGGIRRGE